MTPPYQQIAEAMFNAYNAEGPNPWKTWDGKDVPRWPELNDQVRGKWAAAAKQALVLTAPPPTPPIEWCTVCPHNMAFHNSDGSCGCGTDCAAEKARRR